jgi:hypothetical protein
MRSYGNPVHYPRLGEVCNVIANRASQRNYREFSITIVTLPARSRDGPRQRCPGSLCALVSSGYWSRSPIACLITWPYTLEIDVVRGMFLGQICTQFCA